MENKKIIILDFGTGKVDIYPYDINVWENAEDMTDEYGNYLIDSNCQWMIVDDLKIEIH